MRFRFMGSVAVVAGLCFAAIAMAQPQGQPGQPGGRGRGGPPGGGGFGMFGGGGGFTPSRLRLLQNEAVSKELELADEQVAAIKQLDEELRAKYPLVGGRGGPGGPGGGGPGQPGGDRGRRGGNTNNEGALRTAPTQWYFVAQEQQPGQPGQGRGGRGNFQPPSPEEMAAMEKQRAERDKEANAKLADILLPHQAKRLNEIYIQQAGIAALLDDEVAKLLNVSPAQKTKITEVRQQSQESFGAAMREMFQGGGDRDANRAKMEELRKANEAKVLAVLSADQQKKFEELKGKPFEMPDGGGRGGPGGGRGGPGGTRGRGGNNN